MPTPLPERVGAMTKVWLVPAWQMSLEGLIIFKPKLPFLLIIACVRAEYSSARTTPWVSQSPNFLRSLLIAHLEVPYRCSFLLNPPLLMIEIASQANTEITAHIVPGIEDCPIASCTRWSNGLVNIVMRITAGLKIGYPAGYFPIPCFKI